MEEQIIFSPRVYGRLLARGIECSRKDIDLKRPDRWVYFFERTPEFEQAYREIMNELHGQKD